MQACQRDTGVRDTWDRSVIVEVRTYGHPTREVPQSARVQDAGGARTGRDDRRHERQTGLPRRLHQAMERFEPARFSVLGPGTEAERVAKRMELPERSAAEAPSVTQRHQLP